LFSDVLDFGCVVFDLVGVWEVLVEFVVGVFLDLFIVVEDEVGCFCCFLVDGEDYGCNVICVFIICG